MKNTTFDEFFRCIRYYGFHCSYRQNSTENHSIKYIPNILEKIWWFSAKNTLFAKYMKMIQKYPLYILNTDYRVQSFILSEGNQVY